MSLLHIYVLVSRLNIYIDTPLFCVYIQQVSLFLIYSIGVPLIYHINTSLLHKCTTIISLSKVHHTTAPRASRKFLSYITTHFLHKLSQIIYTKQTWTLFKIVKYVLLDTFSKKNQLFKFTLHTSRVPLCKIRNFFFNWHLERCQKKFDTCWHNEKKNLTPIGTINQPF